MAEILKRNKALAVNPLKASQPVGASLAFLGINKAIPMMHGSQGCTAFGKVYFVRHFREPVPLQTTAMDQVSTVMNADENVLLGLKAVCEKSKPALIGLPTTGLSETQGTDIKRLVKDFYAANPEFAHIPVVPVNTPDFTGCLESGYALAVKAILETMIPASAPCVNSTSGLPDSGLPAGTPSGGGLGRGSVGKRKKQVNVLAGSFLTPGDIEHIKELIEAFGLRPLVLPDIGDSLDGHLTEMESSPLTVGGTPVSDISSMGESIATLVLGNSLFEAADFLKEQTGVPDYRFDSLMGLDAVDGFVAALAEISGKPVPEKIERQRAQLQDAMVDSHFMLGFARVAIAGDPDLLYGFARLVTEMGCEVVAAVAPARANILQDVAAAQVAIGDLEDLENAARKQRRATRHQQFACGGNCAPPRCAAAARRFSAIRPDRRLPAPVGRLSRHAPGLVRSGQYDGGTRTPRDRALRIQLFPADRRSMLRHLRLVKPIEEAEMTVKIAFASSDRRAVNQHFGAAEAFAIYELGAKRDAPDRGGRIHRDRDGRARGQACRQGRTAGRLRGGVLQRGGRFGHPATAGQGHPADARGRRHAHRRVAVRSAKESGQRSAGVAGEASQEAVGRGTLCRRRGVAGMIETTARVVSADNGTVLVEPSNAVRLRRLRVAQCVRRVRAGEIFFRQPQSHRGAVRCECACRRRIAIEHERGRHAQGRIAGLPAAQRAGAGRCGRRSVVWRWAMWARCWVRLRVSRWDCCWGGCTGWVPHE